MTLIIDAGPLIAAHETDRSIKRLIARALATERGPHILSAVVAGEVDYMLTRRFGPGANAPFLEDLGASRLEVECLTVDEYATVARLERQYGYRFGLADLSIVVLAARFNTTRILTFDERHFRAITPLQGGVFTILPADDA